MKLLSLTGLLALGGLLVMGTATPAKADVWNKKTYITISRSIEVPGAVLEPGKYVFKLMNSDSNRHIVQIMNAEENHIYTTNLAFAKQRMEPADKTILTFYEMPGGGPEPVRSWFYPGDTIGQEFAYPRKRANEIANATRQHVPILAEARQPVEERTVVETPAPATVTEPTTQPDNSADRAVTPTEAEPAPPVSSEAAAAEPPTDDQVAAQEPPAASSAPATTPSEPAMPTTAGNTFALGLIGLGCLAIAASLRGLLSVWGRS